jgi:magnesium chelatase family protein
VHSADVQRYRDRISGPLLDRIDIHVEIPAVKYQDLAGDSTGESSAAMPSALRASRSALPRGAFRECIQRVRETQQARFAKTPKIRCNARMTSQQCKLRSCAITAAGLFHSWVNFRF